MNKYSNEDIKKARDLIKPHAGIQRIDIETALDLMGPELGIFPENTTPDITDIAEQTYNNLMEKNLVVPEEYVAPRGSVPTVPEVELFPISEPDLRYRKENNLGNRQEPQISVRQISRMATWKSPKEQEALQREINGYIEAFDMANPPSENRVPKDDTYYKNPKVNIGLQSRYLGFPKENFGLSKADYATLDRNQLQANGCGSGWSSWVPDSTYYGSYSDACNVHDVLYGVPGLPKERADEIFNEGLQNVLKKSDVYNGPIPDEMLYTKAVKRFGTNAYKDAQETAKRSWSGGWHPLQDILK